MDTSNLHDFPEMPKFLRISAEERAASWKGKRLRHTNDMTFKTAKAEPADVRAFRLAEEAKRKAKDQARFKLLRERAAEAKRKVVRS